ncbi:MAG TPA: CusA/CzcA family heavy metal efflux RND transporter [Phycisphaerae bacterium]|nr:CusA/CzcA family heavy metal efflux RND transporter [Phycisphaerae bacterium]
MLNWIIGWSLHHRFLVILFTAVIVGCGAYSLSHLEIDAFPDTTPVQVQINTVAPSLAPVEIERLITAPVEAVIGGIPRLVEMRSISKFGLSQITATFEDGTDIYFARQRINEQLGSAKLPAGIDPPEMGPVATGLGEVFHYIVVGKGESPASLTELTTIHDWTIRPQLLSVRGVAEVNTWGGQRKQFQTLIDPVRLIKYSLTVDDVVEALRRNNTAVGGGYIVRSGEASLVHGVAFTTNLAEIGNIVIEAHDGVPIRIDDVAGVREGFEIRRGGVTAQGGGEVVLGLGFMLMGENSHEVTRRLEARLDEVRKTLPDNVDVQIMYKRTELVDRVIHTVKKNLFEGALLVVAVLFAFLGSLRTGIIVALAIPLAMLFSFSAMLQFGIAASLLSLGAIDFGLVVDSSVIIVENSVRRVGQERDRGGKRPLIDVIRDAAVEVRRPTMFGEMIIMVVYLPILLLEGVEGKLFRPMALTVVFALASSLIFSLTLTPVLCSLLMPKKVSERENIIVRAAHWIHRPFVAMSLRHRGLTIGAGALMIALGAYLATQLGRSFIPRLYEEAITVNTIRLAGVSLEESLRYSTRIEKLLLDSYPDEVWHVWSRTGMPQVATDPMGLELTDVFLSLKPREQWKKAATQAELTDLMAADLAMLPGMRAVFTQPIEMRMNEMIAGIRSDVGIKVFGDDLEELKRVAGQVHSVIEAIPGSADINTEQITGQPVLEILVDQDAIARYGVSADHVLEIVEALGQTTVGQIREGQRRFDLVVKLADQYRNDPESVGGILVPTESGERLALAQLAKIRQVEGPSTISREWGKRRIVVQCNVRGRDLGGFVEEARRRISEDVSMPPGYYATFGGQFEHLERAGNRLMIIVPIALVSIFVLLYFSTGTIRDSLIVLTGAPFAALGGVMALWIRNMDFTIAAGVGFVAVSGVSMLSGLVLVSTIKQRIAAGVPFIDAILETRLIRLRAVLMTALVAALGFVPMALNTGVGAEVQRPLATVVIGGIISDNILTLLVLPAIYAVWGRREPRTITRETTPAEEIAPGV